MYTKEQIRKGIESALLDPNKKRGVSSPVDAILSEIERLSNNQNTQNAKAMSSTIQHDWQYNSLMLASIKDSDHFVRSCMVYPRMEIGAIIARVGNKQTINYYYVPAAKQCDTMQCNR